MYCSDFLRQIDYAGIENAVYRWQRAVQPFDDPRWVLPIRIFDSPNGFRAPTRTDVYDLSVLGGIAIQLDTCLARLSDYKTAGWATKDEAVIRNAEHFYPAVKSWGTWIGALSTVNSPSRNLAEAYTFGAWAVRVFQCNLDVLTGPTYARFDGQDQLHCDDGPAIIWFNSPNWYIHGVRVSQMVVEHPDRLLPPDIDREQNTEVRRVMLERFGMGRYLEESGAEVVDDDPQWGTLFYLRNGFGAQRRESLWMLRVTNRTPEADGTYNQYFLRINPALYNGAASERAQAAWASTWRYRNNQRKLLFPDYRKCQPRKES